MSIKQNITSLQNLLEQVNALPEAGGVELPELQNEGSASDLLYGKQLIDQEGNIVKGAIETFDGSYECSESEIIMCPSLTIYGTLASIGDDITLDKVVYYSGGKLQTLTGFYTDTYEECGLEHNLLNEPYVIQNVDVNKSIIIEVHTSSAHPVVYGKTSENINIIFTPIAGETWAVMTYTATNNNPATINFVV